MGAREEEEQKYRSGIKIQDAKEGREGEKWSKIVYDQEPEKLLGLDQYKQ